MADRVVPLDSGTPNPWRTSSYRSGSLSSSPVGRIATTGRRCTSTVVRPAATRTPSVPGVTEWPASRSVVPRRMS